MRSFLRNIDKIFGKIHVLLFSFFKLSKKKPLKFNRILVIKLWAIGDSVISLSLIRSIKEKYPNSSVEVLTTCNIKDIFKYDKIDKQVSLNSFSGYFSMLFSFNRYDIVFDCEPYFNISALISFIAGKRRVGFSDQYRSRLYTDTIKFRKEQHMVQNYLDMLRVLDIECDAGKLEKIIIPDDELKNVKAFISDEFGDDKIVGICAGISGSVKSRMWYEDRFAELADRIVNDLSMQIVFIDSIRNKPTVEIIRGMMKQNSVSALGKFSLKEEIYLISQCDIFISNDTGPMHIAAAQGCKTIGLFGPNTPVLWAPYGKGNISIYKTELPPSIQNDKAIFEDRNREEYMGVISVDDVFEAVKQLNK